MRRATVIGTMMALLLLPACSDDDTDNPPMTVALITVHFTPETQQIDQFRFEGYTSDGTEIFPYGLMPETAAEVFTESPQSVAILLDPVLNMTPIVFRAHGLRQGAIVASGQSLGTPVIDQTIEVEIDLGDPAVCGDGTIHDPVELCDDQNTEDGDGCSATCRIEPGWSCSGEPSECQPGCGDGTLENSEECDGNDFGGQTCETASGKPGGELACSAQCMLDTSGCHECGDLVMEGPEECDGSVPVGETCEGHGFSGGTVKCSIECTLDTSGCYQCGDGACETSKGEARSNCPQDCAWVRISLGLDHTCAIKVDNSTFCWGSNNDGQLGNGTQNNRSTPVRVSGLSEASSIAAGGHHTCAITTDGTISCWGDNYYWQLGNNSMTQSSTPIQVAGIVGASSVVCGGDHTCATTINGTYCWGKNLSGQLGNGETSTRSLPVLVLGLTGTPTITAGGSHTCVFNSIGDVYCWGSNTQWQLGNNGTSSSIPVQVQIGLATSIAAGNSHSCITYNFLDSVFCWGSNNNGQLGNDSTERSYTPVRAGTLTNASYVIAGNSHTCALISDGNVFCWGNNTYGQLGDGTQTRRLTPVSVQGTLNASFIAAGGDHTCAIDLDGNVFCWGENTHGQLGDGTTSDSSALVQVVDP